MRVTMKTPGSHNGKPFMPGDTIDLDEREAAALTRRGLCATADDDEATPKRGKARKEGGQA